MIMETPEMSKYQASLEIAGPTAIWTRPDTGDAPTSYQVPTRSAVKGVFESILWLPTVVVVPTRVEVSAPDRLPHLHDELRRAAPKRAEPCQ